MTVAAPSRTGDLATGGGLAALMATGGLLVLATLRTGAMSSSVAGPVAVVTTFGCSLCAGLATAWLYQRSRDPVVVLALGLAATWLVFGADYRGSTRWLGLPGVGLVPIGELAATVACLALAEARKRGWSALVIAVSLALGLVVANSKSYAVLILALALLAYRRRLGPTQLALAAAAAGLALGGLVSWTSAGTRLKGFVLGTGPSAYTERKLSAIRETTSWSANPDSADFPWQAPFVFDDFTLLWDAWHLGVGATLLLYGIVYAGARSLILDPRWIANSAVRLYASYAILKLVMHTLSCLGMGPVAGVSPPLVTISTTEFVGLGMLGGAVVGQPRRFVDTT